MLCSTIHDTYEHDEIDIDQRRIALVAEYDRLFNVGQLVGF